MIRALLVLLGTLATLLLPVCIVIVLRHYEAPWWLCIALAFNELARHWKLGPTWTYAYSYALRRWTWSRS